MRRVSATDAARRFGDLLDAVESQGETFVIVRNGRAVALVVPAQVCDGEAVKALLEAHVPDPAWSEELKVLRLALNAESRSWSN
jgi:prevent-host-death family protein